MKSLLASILIVGLYATSRAATAPNVAFGPGATQCTEMGEQFRRSPLLTKLGVLAWMGGFLSEMNAISEAEHQPFKDFVNINPELTWEQISGYCNQHPLGYVYESAPDILAGLRTVRAR